MEIPELFVRISTGFLVLLALTRIMGRKEISQMTFFNFTSAIAIGSIAGGFVTSDSFSIRNGIISLIGWSVFTLVMDFIDLKSKNARNLIKGDPVIVIKEGRIQEDALRKSRLDLNSLKAMLRLKNAFSITDVEYAIFETNGKLSVMKKEPKQPITKSDMNIIKPLAAYPISTELVTDGKIIDHNLEELNLSLEWLQNQLQQAGVTSPSEVFYAEIQQDGTLFVEKKEHYIH